MDDARSWPVRDHAWVTRYRASMARQHVPALALEGRERQLLDAVQSAEAPAADLFGDADALATEDAAELATVDEAVRTSLGGGLRPALLEIGGSLTGIGGVGVLLMIIRGGWSVDIDAAHVLVAAGVLVVFVGWLVFRALFSAGRSVAAVVALGFAGVLAVAGIASAATLGLGHIAASNVPVPLLALGMLGPGVVALVAVSRMPQQGLREAWDDSDWLRRFRGGLRARLMPEDTARGHVAEIEQALRSEGASAFAEFGHPLVLARELAATDRTARARRWWATAIAGTGAPLVIAMLVLTNDSWGVLTIPVAIAFVLTAAVTLVVGWNDRPWVTGQ